MDERNSGSIKHNISQPGFSYDVLKGILNRGSEVSKDIHPVKKVEELKRYLVHRGYLADHRSCWKVKRPISTGILMAVNLHFGYLVEENPFKDTLRLNHDTAEALKDAFPEKNLWITDSPLLCNEKDSMIVDSVCIMHMNENFLTNHGSSNFGKDEEFVLRIMQEQGVISNSARHGDSLLQEADIVDEEFGEQYEIMYEFKNSLGKKKQEKAVKDPEMFLTQMVNNPYIHPSKALLKKFYKKSYTPKYTPNLIVLNCGCHETTLAMLESLARYMKEEQAEFTSGFRKMFVLTQNFISEQAELAQINPMKITRFPCSNEKMGFVDIEPKSIAEMDDDQTYLSISTHIFNKNKIIRMGTGRELRSWFHDMRMFECME